MSALHLLTLPTSLVWTADSSKSITGSCKMTDMDVPPAGGYQFPMVRYTDMEEDMKKDVSLQNI